MPDTSKPSQTARFHVLPLDRISSRHRQQYPECYCGLGPACGVYRQLTPEQRIECSTERRRTMQTYFKNGMGW